MALFIGVDIGGTTSTLAIGDTDRRVLAVSDQFPTTPSQGPESVVAAIVGQAAAEVQKLGFSLDQVQTVGLATPGPATLDGVLLKTPNLDPALWDQCPIRQLLETSFQQQSPGIAVRYIGDGQAAALGEYAVRTGEIHYPDAVLGEAESLDSLFMVIVGTGLGGGEVRNGLPVVGKEGRAGHAGHILLPEYAFRYPHDRQHQVGNARCTAESAISLSALTHQLEYRLSLDQWASHPLNQTDGTYRDKAKQLRELAAAGDELANQLFDDQAHALGIALLCVNYIGDYDRLVIGGGVADLAPHVRDRYQQIAQQAYHQHALDGFRNLDQLHFSVCGDSAPVIGALARALA